MNPLKIAFINMPFARVTAPSIALAQLETILKAQFKNRVNINTFDLNMDYARHVGDFSIYDHPYSSHGSMTGACDWLFRHIAFPDASDNSGEYFDRYYYDKTPEIRKIRKFLETERKGLPRLLDSYIDKYHLLDADIVGFTLFFSQTVASLALARRLKDRKPDIITIIGGASCEDETAQVFAEKLPQIDYVFSGPALVSLPKFIGHVLKGQTKECDRINGVLSKSNGHLWRTQETRAVKSRRGSNRKINTTGDDLDINANIIPDFTRYLDAFEKTFPDGKLKPMLLFETSRGCKWGEKQHCKFCGLNGTLLHYRAMTAENAITQLQALFKYVPRSSFFIATDNMLPVNYISEVLPELTPPGRIQIRYEVRPTLGNKDIGAMCRAGFSRVQPGIESLSTSTLKLMGKGTTAFSNLQFLKNSSRHPFTLDWNLLIYSPGEKEEVYEKYIRYIPFLTHLPPPNAAFPVMFVKFSYYFEHTKEYSLDLKPQDYYGLIFPFNAKNIRRMAYAFVDNKADSERIDYWLEKLNSAIAFWHSRWLNTDSKVQARLCFIENVSHPTVYDSRSGKVVEHRVSTTTRALLEYLESPATMDMIRQQFKDAPEFDADGEINLLSKRGLIFEENGRYLSLIAG